MNLVTAFSGRKFSFKGSLIYDYQTTPALSFGNLFIGSVPSIYSNVFGVMKPIIRPDDIWSLRWKHAFNCRAFIGKADDNYIVQFIVGKLFYVFRQASLYYRSFIIGIQFYYGIILNLYFFAVFSSN